MIKLSRIGVLCVFVLLASSVAIVPVFGESGGISGVKVETLKNYCAKSGGKMIDQLNCPTSGAVRKGPWCESKDSAGNEMFTNGCDYSFGSYGDLFFRACVLHDYCYHHEPVSNGLSRDACNKKLLTDMYEICQIEGRTDEHCHTAAKIFYEAVTFFGGKAWKCSKVEANYPRDFGSLAH